MKLISKIALLAGAAGLWMIFRHKASGVGKVERIKRRVYKEVSMAQSAGVDFSKKYDELSAPEKDALRTVGHDVGWKQSKRAIESGKPYEESYFNSLRRAWNAVSGVQGIGRAWNVKDASGHIVLTWIEDAANHVAQEDKILDSERRAAEARKRYRNTMRKGFTMPVVTKPTESIQQQILKKVPYLKTARREDEYHWKYETRDDFHYVVWIKQYNITTGDPIFEGAKIATLTKADADKIANDERKAYNRRKEAAENDKHKLTTGMRISVIPVEKVKVEAISGIGYLPATEPFWYGIPSVQFIWHGEWSDPELYYRGKYYNAEQAEEEMYAIWRELIDEDRTKLNFDVWMQVAGDILKNDVLPYLPTTR